MLGLNADVWTLVLAHLPASAKRSLRQASKEARAVVDSNVDSLHLPVAFEAASRAPKVLGSAAGRTLSQAFPGLRSLHVTTYGSIFAEQRRRHGCLSQCTSSGDDEAVGPGRKQQRLADIFSELQALEELSCINLEDVSVCPEDLRALARLQHLTRLSVGELQSSSGCHTLEGAGAADQGTRGSSHDLQAGLAGLNLDGAEGAGQTPANGGYAEVNEGHDDADADGDEQATLPSLVVNRALAEISGVRGLAKLSLHQWEPRVPGLHHLSALTALTNLKLLCAGRLATPALLDVCRITGLRKLGLSGYSESQSCDLGVLSSLAHLTSLGAMLIDFEGQTLAMVQTLSGLVHLQRLSVCATQLPTSVAQQLTSLRRLRARTLALAQPTWALLCERCPCLEELEIGSLDLYRHRYTYAMAPGPLPGAALHALGPGPSALAAAAATTGTTAAAPAPGSADPAAAAAPHPVAGASSSRPGSDVGAGVSGEGSSGPLEGTSTSGPTHSNTNTNSSPPGPAPGPAAAAAADAAGASSAPATSTGPVHVPPTSHSLRRLALHNQRGAPPDAPQGPLALVALGACCPRLSSLSASVFGAPTYQQLFMAPLPWDLAELELQVPNMTSMAAMVEGQEYCLSGLAGLHGLRALSFVDSCGSLVTDSSLRQLAPLTALTSLSLKGCRGVTDEGLAVLPDVLPQLEAVRLMQLDEVTDRGLQALTRLTRLRSLHLGRFSPKVTFRSLHSLASLPLLTLIECERAHGGTPGSGGFSRGAGGMGRAGAGPLVGGQRCAFGSERDCVALMARHPRLVVRLC